MRTMNVAGLNIVMPVPHDADRYVDLFIKSYKRKTVVKLRGDFAGMIGSARVLEVEQRPLVVGEFYKFFDLDLNSQWFNVLEEKAAEEQDLAEIKIPEYLKPHFQTFPYVFFPSRHRLVFVTKDQQEALSPGQAHKLLETVFSDFHLLREFGEIEITVEPSTESLEMIFHMPRLKRLNIEVSPPNPDDLDKAEKELFEKMHRLNADKFKTELISKSNDGLELDGETKVLAEIAKSNGKVDGHGEDANGKTIDISTAEHPLIERVEFNPDIQPRSEALLEVALRLIRRFRVGGR